MFDDLLLHPLTQKKLAQLIQRPPSSIVLSGPSNIGKHAIAQRLVCSLLHIRLDQLAGCGMYRELAADKMKIGIDQIRDLLQFFALKTTGSDTIRRVVVIPDAELMTHPAQNALLKTLEEPPSDAVLILTTSEPGRLLPTILSRTQIVVVQNPSQEATKAFLASHNSATEVQQAILMTDGRIGAIKSLLDADKETSEIDLAEIKRILGLGLFEQLLMVETTLKDKATAKQFVDRLAQVSAASLLRAAGADAKTAQWKRISQASYTAGEALARQANPKLVLTELLLSLRA